MLEEESTHQLGHFAVDGQDLLGQLVLAGRDSYLLLHRDSPFRTGLLGSNHILGSLDDRERVSLLQCVPTQAQNWRSDGKEHGRLEVFPHFALLGDQHIRPDESCVHRVTLFLEDAPALFYDFDAFGGVRDPSQIIGEIAARDTRPRPLPVGPDPQVAYFAGQLEILRVDTQMGVFRASHNPGWPIGGPRGVSIKNEISASLEFEEALDFYTSFERTLRLLAFLELAIGRRQIIDKHYVTIGGSDSTTSLRVHWSHSPVRRVDRHDDKLAPQPSDLLLSGVQRKSEFERVMTGWVARDEEFREARQRFHGSFTMLNRYTTDRLVASANMYDLLPPSAVPKDVRLAKDLREAKTKARDLFAELPRSYERDSVLGALGRVGKASLKHKVRNRAEVITSSAPRRFPHLRDVLDEAVNCRNHFVHGSPTRIDYGARSDLVPFLARSLEFVFAAADLVECGWDLRRFLSAGTTTSHPFGAYKAHYAEELASLLQALP